MPVQNNGISWAQKIAAADANTPNFEPVPLGRANFTIKQADLAQGQKGEYIRYRAAIKDGPRANALVFESTYPNAEKIGFFLEFYRATGLGDEWLMGATPPTTDQIRQALVGRDFSAEVYVRDDAKTDKNGDQYRSLKNFRPYAGAAQAPTQSAPQAPANGGFGQPAPQAPAQATSSFGAPVPQPQIPTPDQAQPQAPAADPWSEPAQPQAPVQNAPQATPPNPFG